MKKALPLAALAAALLSLAPLNAALADRDHGHGRDRDHHHHYDRDRGRGYYPQYRYYRPPPPPPVRYYYYAPPPRPPAVIYRDYGYGSQLQLNFQLDGRR